MRNAIPEELREFMLEWYQHKPIIPTLETPTTKQIRQNLGYLPLKLPFEIPHREMLEEARALKEFYVYHRSTGHHRGWRSLVLHGLSSVHSQGHEHYGYSQDDEIPYTWTDISRFCPVSTRFFRDVFGYARYARVRFMLLEPGGFILPHEDVEWKSLSPINIALNNPHGCDFVMRDWGLIPFEDGSANMLAVGYEHAVFNDSNEDRYHIIVHGEMGEKWPSIIANSYNAMRDGS
jgi:hypothetical protein